MHRTAGSLEHPLPPSCPSSWKLQPPSDTWQSQLVQGGGGGGIPAHQQSCSKESTRSDSPRTQSNAKSQGARPPLRGRGWKARTGPKMRRTRWEPSRSGHRASGPNQPLHTLHVAFAHLPPWGENRLPAPNPHLLDGRNSEKLTTCGEKPHDTMMAAPELHMGVGTRGAGPTSPWSLNWHAPCEASAAPAPLKEGEPPTSNSRDPVKLKRQSTAS